MVRAVDKADAMHADAFQRSIISEAIYHLQNHSKLSKMAAAVRIENSAMGGVVVC